MRHTSNSALTNLVNELLSILQPNLDWLGGTAFWRFFFAFRLQLETKPDHAIAMHIQPIHRFF